MSTKPRSLLNISTDDLITTCLAAKDRAEACAILGVSDPTLWAELKHRGLPGWREIRRGNGVPHSDVPWSDQRVGELVRLAGSGMTFAAIADAMDLSIGAIAGKAFRIREAVARAAEKRDMSAFDKAVAEGRISRSEKPGRFNTDLRVALPSLPSEGARS